MERKNGNEYILRAAWTVHRGALATAHSEAEEYLGRLLPGVSFAITDSSPDIILFMSGGSERRVIELADTERPVLLLSIRGNNAYASATEVTVLRLSETLDSSFIAEGRIISRPRLADACCTQVEIELPGESLRNETYG